MPVAGYLKSDDCGRKPSSLKSIHVSGNKEITSMTYDGAANNWSAITMAASNVFKPYEFKAGEAELNLNPVVENGVTKYSPTVTFKAEKLSPSSLAIVEEFADYSFCGMTFICTDFYGVKWVVGWDELIAGDAGCQLTSAGLTTGRGLSGAQGGDIVVTAEHAKPPRVLFIKCGYTSLTFKLCLKDIAYQAN